MVGERGRQVGAYNGQRGAFIRQMREQGALNRTFIKQGGTEGLLLRRFFL